MATWKAEIEKVNGIKQILWEYGTKKGVTICEIESNPEDAVAFVKSKMSPKAIEQIEEEGKKEVPLPKMPEESA
tara:strand:+ start:20 stop:241 length:222 start_codon:yes stop_codon:yes gene_type:complete